MIDPDDKCAGGEAGRADRTSTPTTPDAEGRSGDTRHGSAAAGGPPGLPSEIPAGEIPRASAAAAKKPKLPDPRSVLDDVELTREQKIEKLRRWSYDARELEVANDEGMGGAVHASNLPAIHEALRELGACEDPAAEHSH